VSKPLVKWKVNPGRTGVIVVDMQKVFCEPAGALYVKNTARIIAPIQALLAAAREQGLTVIYLRHIVRGDGADTGRMRDLYPNVDEILARGDPDVQVIDALEPAPADIIVDKLFYSGFHNTDLDTILRARDIDTLVVCGTVTNVCCETTIRDGVHREYKMIALSDANAAMDYPDLGFGAISADEIQRLSLTTIAYEFGEVTTTADIVERLRGC
jgi:ureidoacrylate peracid hydrolase